MALRDFSAVNYIPLLGLRPAEMRALQELPNSDKDSLLPLIGLRRWTTSHRLDSSLSKISSVYGDRPLVIELGEEELVNGERQEVHDSLDALRNPADGYRNWCSFVEEHENMVPAIQFADPTHIVQQLRRFRELGRGVVVRLPEHTHAYADELAQIIRQEIPDDDVCFIIDYAAQNRNFLLKQRDALWTANGILERMPNTHIAFSASSFPETFVDITRQAVHEREFFNEIRPLIESENLIYSDRGSARAERRGGGGGSPAPRVDYATVGEWTFQRLECDDGVDRFPFYQRAATAVIGSDEWDRELRLWGCQMIERTAAGDESAISSPPASTAARINIHLHQQLFHDRPGDQYDTEDEWDDL